MPSASEHGKEMIEQWLKAGRLTGEPDPHLIKRAHSRLPIGEDFVIRGITSTAAEEVFVKGYNISPNGLGVISKRSIEAESKIQIQGETCSENDPWLDAIVIHSTMTIGGYKVGLCFETARDTDTFTSY